MKNKQCIIQLKFVPEYIIRETDGDINQGMYLQLGAVDSLLRGEMFSAIDCLWSFASRLPLSIAKQANLRLKDLGIVGSIIYVN